MAIESLIQEVINKKEENLNISKTPLCNKTL